MGATGKSGIKGVREASLKRRENLEPALNVVRKERS